MDSKLKTLTILGCVGMILLVLLLVVNSSEGFRRKKASMQSPLNNNSVEAQQENSETDENIQPQSGNLQIGNNLKAFLNDSDFFDSANDAASLVYLDTNQLTLLATSVQKDLRVRVVDYEGDTVSGQDFVIRLTNSEGKSVELKDLDQDGVIYAGSLVSGTYEIDLLPVEGFKTPAAAMSVNVKDRVEYIPIDDISILLKTENDIDPLVEDTQEQEAELDGDNTQIVELIAGGNREKAGIDVSKYQKEIDWQRVADAGIQFAVIRAGYRGSKSGSLVEDPYFARNIEGAKKAGLEVGIYFFTQATNEAEAVEEASACLELTKDYVLDLPIYIDTEGAGGNGRADGLDVDTRTLVCEAFCRTIENTGKKSGIYASRNWFNNNLHMEKLGGYQVWLAEYREKPKYEGYYTMWQYTSSGQVDGIAGRVDLDVYYY